jgi:hypothetical protein
MMQVGACGICCDVCVLKTKEICQGCTAGNTPEAKKKVEFLKKIGVLCPVLECATKNNIAFCSKDCKEFPCKVFEETEFPFSKKFIQMIRNRKTGDIK